MRYREFLGGVHEVLQPPTYLEVGVRAGESLSLSRTKSIGIDPDFRIREELACDLSLFKTTSDEYFSRPEPLAPFGGERIAFSFIDGMHLFEYALRDFINVEKHSDWTTAIVIDDVLPRSNEQAARERRTRAWTGDVYKLMAVLRRYRPELVTRRVDTGPTGLLLVLGADPTSTTLREQYDEIVEEFLTPDPQQVPEEVLNREGATEPRSLLSAPFWHVLRDARARGVSRRRGMRRLTRSLGGSSANRLERWVPSLRSGR